MLKSCLALTAALALTACSSGVGEVFDTRQNVGPCPPAGAIYDAARLVELDGGGELFSNIRFTGEITGVRLQCRYVENDPIAGELEIDFAFGRGPAADAQTHNFPYFVTVTRRDASVLARQDFVLTADFRNGPVTAVTETIGNITIPRADGSISGANFEILVGFDLSEDQLAFNRDGKRFRLDAQVDGEGS